MGDEGNRGQMNDAVRLDGFESSAQLFGAGEVSAPFIRGGRWVADQAGHPIAGGL
jgi:hypothetical protein